MKYYSEITKKTYETVEELQKEEASTKGKLEAKASEQPQEPIAQSASERKEAAKKVELAFENVSKLKKANESIREEIDKKVNDLERKYQKLHMDLEEQQRQEMVAIEEQHKELNKGEEKAIEEAYAKLREFCKEFGAYHYSVNTNDSNIFPMLMGFGQAEKISRLFDELFRNFMF